MLIRWNSAFAFNFGIFLLKTMFLQLGLYGYKKQAKGILYPLSTSDRAFVRNTSKL